MANFHVDSSGNLWLGQNTDDDFSTALTQTDPNNPSLPRVKFYVTSAGTVNAISGTIGGISVNSSDIQANYSSGSSGFKIDSSGGAEFNGPILTFGKVVGSPSSTNSIEIGDAKLYNADISSTSSLVSTKSFIVLADGDEANPSIAIDGQYSTMGFFVDVPLSGVNRMQITNGTNNVASWDDQTTAFTVTDKLIVAGSLQASGSTGSSGQVLQSTGTGVQWADSSGNDHPDSDHTSFASSGHNHDGEYVDTVSGSTDALTISGRNITLNFGTTGTRVAAGNHNHDGDYSTGPHLQLVSSGGTNGTSSTASRSDHNHGSSTHTHTSVLSFSANEINIYGSVKPSSNNSRTIGTSSSLRFADMYSQEFYGQYFYGTLINSSSENVKTNIADTGLGLDFIEALPIKQFNYITEGHSDKKYTGVIAEDVQDILDANGWDDYYLVVDNSNNYRFNNRCQHPAICSCGDEDCEEGNYFCQDDCCSSYFKYTEEDGTVTNWVHHTVEECEAFEVDGNRHPHFNYYQLVGPLVKAVQELSTQVSDLTARIETLEG